jgi:hypothetical protein
LSSKKTVDRILRFFKHLFEGVSLHASVRRAGYGSRDDGDFSWLALRNWLRTGGSSVNHSYRRSIEQVFGSLGCGSDSRPAETVGGAR